VLADTPVLNAIASPRRREILRLVWRTEMAAGAIHQAMPDVTFGAISLQLRTLVEAGLVEARADGRRRLYHARRDAFGPVGRMLEGMWSDALWHLKLQAELVETRRGPRPADVLKAESRVHHRRERERALAGRGGGRLRQGSGERRRSDAKARAPRQTKRR
jgi:DNA-binding transcriptional ArsR family regulator